MRRRILVAIIGLTILATATLTIPLAIVSSLRARDEALRELSLVAEKVAAEFSVDELSQVDAADLSQFEDALDVAIYLPTGQKVAGNGPTQSDNVVATTDLATTNADAGPFLVLARPIVVEEEQVGVIRVAEPLSELEGVIRRDLLMLFGFDAGAILLAGVIGWFVSARLLKPLDLIRSDAERLGNGDFTIEARQSGISELETTSAALSDTAGRLESAIQREREFAANASHQLRTPLTSLRLTIEGELLSPRGDAAEVLQESLTEIDRLEGTIATLLDASRQRTMRRQEVDVTMWMSGVEARWAPSAAELLRSLNFVVAESISMRLSRPVLDEILDVLISNALGHGAGSISVESFVQAGTLTVTVADEGSIVRKSSELFVRHDPGAYGTGVGLSLARALAEGEGGRLVLHSSAPTAFWLTVPEQPLAQNP